MAAQVHIPATILFPENEIGTYVRWQLQQSNIPQSRHYALPTALEYERFTKWREELQARCRSNMPGVNLLDIDSISAPSSSRQVEGNVECDMFEKAEVCGHALHPALLALFARWPEDKSGLSNPEDLHGYSSPSYPSPPSEDGKITSDSKENSTPLRHLHCPVCTLRIHLTFLQALLSSWSYYGGPWRIALRPEEDQGKMYNFCNRAYHRAKVDMINSMQDFENWALSEQAWARMNPEVDIRLVEPYCAREAVRLFREQTIYLDASVDKDPEDLEEASNEVKSSPNNSTSSVVKKPKKKLTWTASTPQETRHTPTRCYNRSCTFWYNPKSPHACQDEEGWYDTSHMKDHLFALSQCRILRLVWSPGAKHMTYFDLNTTVMSPEGTIIRRFGDNKHIRRLQSMVLQWVTTLEESEKWLEYLETTADIFLVLKRDWSEGDDFDRFEMVTTLNSPGMRAYAKMVGDVAEDEEEPTGAIVIGGNAEGEDVSVIELEGEEWVDVGSDSGSMNVNVGQGVDEGSGYIGMEEEDGDRM